MFVLMIRRPPRSTRTDTLVPYTTLFRSKGVCALIAGGGYAEYAVAPLGTCLPKPESLSWAEAAALPETLFTVWVNVFERSEEHTSELQSLMRNSYAVFCLKQKKTTTIHFTTRPSHNTL